jgi:hypothetical protein
MLLYTWFFIFFLLVGDHKAFKGRRIKQKEVDSKDEEQDEKTYRGNGGSDTDFRFHSLDGVSGF